MFSCMNGCRVALGEVLFFACLLCVAASFGLFLIDAMNKKIKVNKIVLLF